MKSQNNQEKLLRLMEKGFKIPNPSTVLIEEDVDTERISGEGVVLYSGCKILEKGTLIMSGAKLGYEALLP